ncbi:MAG: thioredoxin family protein [Planctomycetota bacterium]
MTALLRKGPAFSSLTAGVLAFLLAACAAPTEGVPDPSPAQPPSAAQLGNESSESPHSSPDPNPEQGSNTYPAAIAEALARGRKEQRVVMVELFDRNCIYCRKMQPVWSAESVKQALQRVIHVRITPADSSVIEKFDLFQSPTILFFKPGGELMEARLDGFRSAEVFAAEIANAELLAQGKPARPVPRDPHPDFGKG